MNEDHFPKPSRQPRSHPLLINKPHPARRGEAQTLTERFFAFGFAAAAEDAVDDEAVLWPSSEADSLPPPGLYSSSPTAPHLAITFIWLG